MVEDNSMHNICESNRNSLISYDSLKIRYFCILCMHFYRPSCVYLLKFDEYETSKGEELTSKNEIKITSYNAQKPENDLL